MGVFDSKFVKQDEDRKEIVSVKESVYIVIQIHLDLYKL